MAKKRERLEVIYDMLKAIERSGGSLKPTRLLYGANVSPQMFKEYTAELLDKGFIMEEATGSGRKHFELTSKGYKFLEEYKVIQNFIDSFGL